MSAGQAGAVRTADTASAATPVAEALVAGALVAETWADVEPPAARRLLVGAAAAFAERGFHATTTRDIAKRAGMSPGGLYVHFRSKEELLYRISFLGHRKALAVAVAAAEGTDQPVARLRAVVRAFVTWHAVNHSTVRVIQYEHAALSAPHLTAVVGLRREIDRVVREVIEAGVRSGDLYAPDIGGAALAILSLSIDVGRWYGAAHRQDPSSLGELYADLAHRMLRAPAAGAQPSAAHPSAAQPVGAGG